MMTQFSKCSYILVNIFLTIQFFTSATDDYCNALYDKYPGYDECRTRMSWLKDNWQDPQYKPEYVAAGIDGSWCSIQRYLVKTGQYCPDPDWLDTSANRQIHIDGSQSFLVYRALSAENVAHPNPYAYKLLNCNAADISGVLAYLQTEVVPEYQRNAGGWEVAANARKFGIDSVVIFNVTIKTPAWVKKRYGDILGPFSAMDSGKCTSGDKSGQPCDFEGLGLYLPGIQTQNSNPRDVYPVGHWYSFPECGYCEKPTGDKYCTYTYEVLGKIRIDDFVGLPIDTSTCVIKSNTNFYGSDIRDDGWAASALDCCTKCQNVPLCNAWTWNGPGDGGDFHCWLKKSDGDAQTQAGVTSGSHPRPSFYEFSKGGGIEYQTSVPSPTNDCVHADSTYPNTIKGLDYWYSPCDKRMNVARMERFSITSIDTSVKQPGSPPDISSCPSAKPTPSPASSKLSSSKETNTLNGNAIFIITVVVIAIIFVGCYLYMRINPQAKSTFLTIGDQLKQRQIQTKISLPRQVSLLPIQGREYSCVFVVTALSTISVFFAVLYLCVDYTFLIVLAVITMMFNLIYLCLKTGFFFSIIHQLKGLRMQNQLDSSYTRVNEGNNTIQ